MKHQIDTPFGEPDYIVLGGSRCYGIDTAESDYDYIAAVIEPEEYRIGLNKFSQDGNPQHGFEQWKFKGDNYEGSCYSLWKLSSMFANGDPTTLCLLFAEPIRDTVGITTPEFRDMVVSARSGRRFLKYMEAQRKSMTGERASHTKRPELEQRHGFDTKFAGHLLRLGYQGCEFVETGRITLPMPDESPISGSRLNVMEVRNGLWTMKQVVDESLALQARMERAMTHSDLPSEPDYKSLNEWLIDQYQADWSAKGIDS